MSGVLLWALEIPTQALITPAHRPLRRNAQVSGATHYPHPRSAGRQHRRHSRAGGNPSAVAGSSVLTAPKSKWIPAYAGMTGCEMAGVMEGRMGMDR